MRIKRAYRRTDVKKIETEVLRDRAIRLGGAGTTVGLDIGKDEIVVCIRWPNGEFERPWKVANTAQIGLYRSRFCLTPTRSASEVANSRPRWRFGLA